jgi:predicted RNA binding protein YcfA (HicA-like mRNA interferase family)
MVRGVNNWKFRDIVQVLECNMFILYRTRGSHYYYRRLIDGVPHTVCVPRHGSAIKPRTMKGIIEQSGLGTDAWHR